MKDKKRKHRSGEGDIDRNHSSSTKRSKAKHESLENQAPHVPNGNPSRPQISRDGSRRKRRKKQQLIKARAEEEREALSSHSAATKDSSVVGAPYKTTADSNPISASLKTVSSITQHQPGVTSALSTTFLLKRPVKQWHEHEPDVSTSKPIEGSRDHALSTNYMKSSLKPQRSSSASKILATQVNAQESASTTSSEDPPKPNIALVSSGAARFSRPDAFKSIRGGKITSIPSFSGGADAESTRRRFNAFANAVSGHDEDDSDDESESDVESASEDYDAKPRAFGRGSFSESFAEELQKLREMGKRKNITASKSADGFAETTNGIDDDIVVEEEAVSGIVDESENAETSVARHDAAGTTHGSTTSTIWPANVGVKRSVSQGHHGGTQSGRGQDEASATTNELHEHERQHQTVTSALDLLAGDEDDPEYILAVVNQTADFVFNDTRPLPASIAKLKSCSRQSRSLWDDVTHPATLAPTSEQVFYAPDVGTPDLPRNSRARNVPAEQLPLISDTDNVVSTSETAIPGGNSRTKRKMTGITSKHFSSAKRRASTRTTTQEKNKDEEIPSPLPGPLNNDLPRTPSQPGRISTISSRTRSATHNESKEDVITPNGIHNLDTSNASTEENTEFVTPMQQVSEDEYHTAPNARRSKSAPSVKSKRKSTGKVSHHFTAFGKMNPELRDRVDMPNTGSPQPCGRVPAGTSTVPVPSINEPKFGIIQERLWDQPFWLLIAVTFLNKTAGRAAAPIFWDLKKRYATPEALAEASQDDLHDLIYHLGLQNQRAKRLIKIAKAWVERPPSVGIRFRTLHYPAKGDGKEFKPSEIVEEDSDQCGGALEIGHIPGCGAYAWDSWRIFCRDVLRGVARDYKGNGAADRKNEDFEPEWQCVLPLDKELRACLRWMWLREGWIWDPLTGDKRRATEEEMVQAVKGQMQIEDPEERKFAVQAADHELSGNVAGAKEDLSAATALNDGMEPSASPRRVRARNKQMLKQTDQPRTPERNDVKILSDNVAVTPQKPLRVRRSTKAEHKSKSEKKSDKPKRTSESTRKASSTPPKRRSQRLAETS